MVNIAWASNPEQYYTHMHAVVGWSTREVRGHTVHMDDITTKEVLQVDFQEGLQWVL